MVIMAICQTCGVEKPQATNFSQYQNKFGNWYYKLHCKECIAADSRNRASKVLRDTKFRRVCNECFEPKLLRTDFAKSSRQHVDGTKRYWYKRICRSCTYKRQIPWRQQNPEAVKAAAEKWRKNNRDREVQRVKDYRARKKQEKLNCVKANTIGHTECTAATQGSISDTQNAYV